MTDPDPTQTPPGCAGPHHALHDKYGVGPRERRCVNCQTPPPDAALPALIERALYRLHSAETHMEVELLRNHTKMLTARVRELEANPPPVLLTPGLPDLDEVIGNVRNPSWDIARHDRQVLGAMLSARERIAALAAQNASLRSEQAALVAERDALRGEVGELKRLGNEMSAAAKAFQVFPHLKERVNRVLDAWSAWDARLQAQGEAPSDE